MIVWPLLAKQEIGICSPLKLSEKVSLCMHDSEF